MNTFSKIWDDVFTPEDALRHIEEEKKRYGVASPSNLEEQAINMVGKTIYDKLIKEYTEIKLNIKEHTAEGYFPKRCFRFFVDIFIFSVRISSVRGADRSAF